MKIALLAGDGIGPEILTEAVRVLDVLRGDGLPIETEAAFVGGAAYDDSGEPLPKATLELVKQSDAVLFGAVGGTKYDNLRARSGRRRRSWDCARNVTSSRTCGPRPYFPSSPTPPR
jgi:3-isopropylmalate dehydrogenase